MRGCYQVDDSLLPGDSPDEHRHGPVRIDPELGQHRPGTRGPGRIPRLGVDPVPDDVHQVRIQAGIDPQHVVAHCRTDRNDRVGGQHRGLLDPCRYLVAAAELLLLPWPQRFERMCGQNMRDVVEYRGQMPRQSGVPGV